MRISNLALLGFLASISWVFSQNTAVSYELESTGIQQPNLTIPQWQDAEPVFPLTTSRWSNGTQPIAQNQLNWLPIAAIPATTSVNPNPQHLALATIPSVPSRQLQFNVLRNQPTTEITSNQIINPQPTLIKSVDLRKLQLNTKYRTNNPYISVKNTIGAKNLLGSKTKPSNLVISPTILAIANPKLNVHQVLNTIESTHNDQELHRNTNAQNPVPSTTKINPILGIIQPTNRSYWLAATPNESKPQNNQPSSNYLAQEQPSDLLIPATPPLYQPSQEEYEQIIEQLKSQETEKQAEVQFGDTRRGSPAITIANPHAFGADNWTGFVSFGYQADTRYSKDAVTDDAGVGIGIGIGDARKAVGLELSYTLASFGGSRDFGSGGFNAKLHRRLGETAAVAVGWNGFVNIGDDNDFENSPYITFSKIFKTRDDIASPFSRIALTGGCGGGQFGSVGAIEADYDEINCFGSAAVRVLEPVSVIAEWTAQDFGVGVSYAPFKNFPLVITPAVRDLFGNSDSEPRFVLGVGFGWKF